jgi:hypothetical protein
VKLDRYQVTEPVEVRALTRGAGAGGAEMIVRQLAATLGAAHRKQAGRHQHPPPLEVTSLPGVSIH